MLRVHCQRALFCAMILGLGGCAGALSGFEPAREVVCLTSAKVTLKDAIDTAETRGGRAIAAHYHQDEELGCYSRKPGYYDVTLVSEGNIASVAVDASSREIVQGNGSGSALDRTILYFERLFGGEQTQKNRMAADTHLNLAKAIATAEKSSGRMALKAYLDSKNGKRGYTVKLVDRGKVLLAWVDEE